MSRWPTARAAMLSTTLPSLTTCAGTRTPGRVASTSKCGVMSLSAIHSYNARSRYGRWLVILGVSSLIRGRSFRQRTQVAFLRGEAARESGVAEDAVAVVLDHLAVLRQADAEIGRASCREGEEIWVLPGSAVRQRELAR